MIEQSLGAVVRRLRERQNMSLRTLAERVGFSASFLSQVENGQASPSISSMERIAVGLGVSLGEFFQAAESTSTISPVVRAGSRSGLNSEWSKARLEALGYVAANGRLEPVMVTLDPGGTSGKHVTARMTEEFAFVIAGSVCLTLGEEDQVLEPGDAVTIRPGVPRRWQNLGDTPAQIVVVAASPGG